MGTARTRLLLLLGLLGAFLSACSTPAMKATPIWDRNYERAEGPPSDRINLWPLFYYRKPAVSVLWPLISATDEGHAAVPFYEWNDSEQELRLLTLHPGIPAGAIFDRDAPYWRVLNVIRSKRDQELTILPVAHFSREGFWTPLVTHLESKARTLDGVLGPLFFLRRAGDRKDLHAPFPVFALRWGDDGFGLNLLPAFAYQANDDETTLNVAALLLHANLREDRRSIHWLWPLGAFGSEGDEKRWNRFLPLWYGVKKGEDATFLSIPWCRWQDADGSWDTWLGLVHRFQGVEGGGHALLPLYFRRRGPDDDETLFTLLGGYSRRGDEQFVDVLGPLYYRESTADGHYQSVLWPLWHDWRDPDERGVALAPLFLWSQRGDHRVLHSLLFSWGQRGPNAPIRSLGVILWRYDSNPDRTRSYFLWPLVGLERYHRAHRTRFWLAPLFSWGRSPESQIFWSIPFSVSKPRVSRAVLEQRAIEGVANLMASPAPGERHVTKPLYRYGALFDWLTIRESLTVRGVLASSEMVLGPDEREVQRDDGPALRVTTRLSRKRSLQPLFDYEWREHERSHFQILWRLFDTQSRVLDNGNVYARSRVLWRLYHHETLGEQVSVDVFPFVAYDRAENHFEWSFMAGLVGYRNEAGSKRLRLFYVPIPL